MKKQKKQSHEHLSIDVASVFNEIAESPEKLDVELAIDIYNHYPKHRNQIYGIFFAEIEDFEAWLEIYRLSDEYDFTLELAKKNLAKCVVSNLEWVLLYETTEDEFLQNLSMRKIKKQAKTFEQWKEIYDNSSYGFDIKKLAIVKMREACQSHNDWLSLYESSPFDTRTNSSALENVLLSAKEKLQDDVVEQEQTQILDSAQKWKEIYDDEEDLYSKRKDDALLHMYMSLA